ncbi:unnamed protein product [Zymoseptoria tritici ST99CH_3D1]|nr:unnamed protein product [Zymoseptoria tritici ST99CH_3D1]
MAAFLQYHEPGIVSILILISFFTFLWVAGYISKRVIRAGIIGPIAVGIIYGEPLANILQHDWQETFLYLGYIGLILIIFEGGLTTRLDLLRANLTLSVFGATTGVVLPIAFSYLLLYLGFGYGAVETFIIGAALSATSLGTTFAVISGASKDVDLANTRVGAILVSAAVIDDVTGLVMSSVIHDLGDLQSGGASLGWLIGRPILASALMAILTPVLSKWVLAPFFRKVIEPYFHRFDHLFNIIFMILVLSAFLSIAAYAGTSVLFGAFLAGSFLTYLPSRHPDGPFVALVGVWILIWTAAKPSTAGEGSPGKGNGKGRSTSDEEEGKGMGGRSSRDDTEISAESGHSSGLKAAVSPAILLGMAMVARGEIGLLIVEIGYNNTDYVSNDGFVTAVWAILLNTILGPIAVGLMVKYKAKDIATGVWGLVPKQGEEESTQSGHDDSRAAE